VAVDRGGNVYVSDAGDYRIQKLSARGKLLATWGTDEDGALTFGGPGTLGIDGQDDVFVADRWPATYTSPEVDSIVKLSPTGRVVGRWRVGSKLDHLVSIAVAPGGTVLALLVHTVQPGPAGSIVIARGTILKLSNGGKRLATWQARLVGGNCEMPVGIGADKGGNAYVTIGAAYQYDFRNGCESPPGSVNYFATFLQKFSPAGHLVFSKEEPATPLEWAMDVGMTVDAGGNVYVPRGDAVWKVSPTGTILAKWKTLGPCGPESFPATTALAFSRTGTLYAAGGAVVQRLSVRGQPRGSWGGCPPPEVGQPSHVAVGPDGDVYVADGYQRIVQLSRRGTVLARWDGLGPVAVGADGSIYDVSTSMTQIEKRSSDGVVVARFGLPDLGAGDAGGVGGIVVGPDGMVYVTLFDGYEHPAVEKLSPSGEPLARWGTWGQDPGQFKRPGGLALDGDGNLYVADTVNGRIQKLSPTGQPVASWSTYGEKHEPFNQPMGVAVDRQGHVYVADTGANRVVELSSSGETLYWWGSRLGMGLGQFSAPFGVATDSQDAVYVADDGNSRIQRLMTVAARRVDGTNSLVEMERSELGIFDTGLKSR
jgi:DNA-binding beta-propeller fold protein YncE